MQKWPQDRWQEEKTGRGIFAGKGGLAAYSCVATCRVAGDNMLLEETISGQARA